jgi:hypothetical protein
MGLKMGYQMSLNPLSVVRERQVRVRPPVQLIIIWVKAYVITMACARDNEQNGAAAEKVIDQSPVAQRLLTGAGSIVMLLIQ